MKKPTLLKAALPTSLVTLVVAVVLGLLVGILSAVSFVAIVSGALAIASRVATNKPVRTVSRIGLGLGLALVALAGYVDRSWVSALVVALTLAGATYLVRYAKSQFLVPDELSPLVKKTLSQLSYTLAGEPASGWWSALGPRAEVILIREISASAGDPANWPSVKKINASLAQVLSAFSENDITPTPIALVGDASGISLKLNQLRVVSPDKLSGALANTRPSISDPRALAAKAGVNVSRAVVRQATKAKATKSQGATKPKIVHQGRVTKKI